MPSKGTGHAPLWAGILVPVVSSSKQPWWPVWPAAGVDVVRLGVLPTPAVAYLTGSTGSDLGVMLSASHNPMPDNGIKFLARGGIKLDDVIEDAIEVRVGEEWQRPTGAAVGRVLDDGQGFETYVSHLVRSAPNRFDGVKVVIDCANGAASLTAPEALQPSWAPR